MVMGIVTGRPERAAFYIYTRICGNNGSNKFILDRTDKVQYLTNHIK
jgi:hypothetical protein